MLGVENEISIHMVAAVVFFREQKKLVVFLSSREQRVKLCTSNGLLDKKAYKTLASDASKPLLRRLLGRGGRVPFEELPKEWSKNI